MKVLANDGISQAGIEALQSAGIEIETTKVAQEQLADYINNNNIDAVLVRSATTIRKPLIDACPNLKLIGRGGVGMDNIDVAYAKEKGIHVINTPAASSHSVAELVFAHMFGLARFLHSSNRDMPLDGDRRFKDLKKAYANGVELKGKTLGIIGFKYGQTNVWIQNISSRKRVRKQLMQFNIIKDFDIVKDGNLAVLSADRNGMNDLYLLSLKRNSIKRLTWDIYDDIHPRFVPGTSSIVFSSNRPTDSIRTNDKNSENGPHQM